MPPAQLFELAEDYNMPHITTSDGVRLSYQETGWGDPVVLIQGLGFPGDVWAPIVDRLPDTYRVITLDNRGVGSTQAPDGPFSIFDMAGDVAELLTQVVGSPAHVVGFSMGGMIAQHLAGAHPQHVRSLALLSTTVRPNAQTDARVNLWRRMALGGTPREILIHSQLLWCCQNSFFDNPDALEQIIAHLTAQPASQTPQDFIRQIEACRSHDATSVVPNIRSPAVVLVGPEERFFSIDEAQQLARMIPGASCKILSSGAHNAWMENPDEVTEELLCLFAEAQLPQSPADRSRE